MKPSELFICLHINSNLLWMKVDFMIIGAMKCGTSSLATLLGRHPDIVFSKPKETNFFTGVKNWRDNLQEYERFFCHKTARLHGEGSTDYTKFPACKLSLCDNLYEYNPELRFIYMVRHPVHRAISQYMHFYRRGYTDQGFSSSIDMNYILPVGRYYMQIQPYIEKFGRDRVLILKFEDFVADQRAALRQVCQFLGIEYKYPENMQSAISNPTLGRDVLLVSHERFFKNYILPMQGILHKQVIKKIRDRFVRLNKKRTFHTKITISPEDEKLVLHYSALDMQKLQEIVTFDLSDYFIPVQELPSGVQ